jgi:hypothetical protein
VNWYGPLIALAILALVIGYYLRFLNQGRWYRRQRAEYRERLDKHDPNWGMSHGGEMSLFEWVLGLALGGGVLVYLVGRELGFFGK